MHGPNEGARPSQAPPPREVWCEEHRRPVGPDGRCSLCVETEDPARSERRVVLVVVAIALLGGIGPAAYYFFWARHEEDRNAAARVERSSVEAPGKKGKAGPMLEQWVDEETPPMDVAKDPKAKARRERKERREARSRKRAHRRRKTRGRQGGSPGRWNGALADDAPSSGPRAATRVPITMYMAHW